MIVHEQKCLILGEYRRLAGAGGTGPAAVSEARHATGPPTPRLTDRETEVLRLVAKGLTYPQIAARLHNKAQLVRYALENGVE